MSKLKLTAPQYEFFYKKIMEKFGEYCESQNFDLQKISVNQIFGFGKDIRGKLKFIPNRPNLQSHITADNDFITCCLENNITDIHTSIGKYIYDKYLKAKKGNSITLTNDIYTKAIFRYANYENVNSFLSQFEKQKPSSLPSKIEEVSKENWTEYLGFLCSTRIEDGEIWKSKGIGTFILRINFESQSKTTEEYYTEAKITDEPDENTFYTGLSNHRNHNLHISLISSENRNLVLFLATGGSVPQTIEVMRGMYLGVSKFTMDTIGAELIVIRKDRATEQKVNKIKQYLRTNHLQIRVGRKTFLYRDIINPKNNRGSELKLADFVGTHWWLDKSYEGVLDLSKLIVTPNLESYVEYRVTKKQETRINPCYLSFYQGFLYIQINELGQSNEGEGRYITIGYAIFQKQANANYPYFLGKQLVNGHRKISTTENVVLIKREEHFPKIETGLLGTGDRKEIIKFLLQQQPQFKDCFNYLLERGEDYKMREQELQKQRKLFDDILAELE